MRIRIVDAFTDRPFGGNPAAVCLLDEADAWPDEAWMQQVAAEMNLAETAFAHPLTEAARPTGRCAGSRPGRDEPVRPRDARDRLRDVPRPRPPGTVRFVSRSGVLVAHTADDGTITLDFPAAPADRDARARRPRRGARRHPAGHVLDRRARRPAGRARRRGGRPRARPGPRRGRRALPAATAPRRHRDRARRQPGGGYDFVSRFFAPADGIAEDPVTGSAHTALAPFWSGASAATSSPACRPRPAPALCARRSAATASTSPATRSSSSTAR